MSVRGHAQEARCVTLSLEGPVPSLLVSRLPLSTLNILNVGPSILFHTGP